MAEINLKGRHFLKLLDFTPEEIHYLIDLATEYKDKKKKGTAIRASTCTRKKFISSFTDNNGPVCIHTTKIAQITFT